MSDNVVLVFTKRMTIGSRVKSRFLKFNLSVTRCLNLVVWLPN